MMLDDWSEENSQFYPGSSQSVTITEPQLVSHNVA